jgi:hypothetical protein
MFFWCKWKQEPNTAQAVREEKYIKSKLSAVFWLRSDINWMWGFRLSLESSEMN